MIRALAFDPLDRRWIENWEGVFQFDGLRYWRFGMESDCPYRRVSALLFDNHGALWIGIVVEAVIPVHPKETA